MRGRWPTEPRQSSSSGTIAWSLPSWQMHHLERAVGVDGHAVLSPDVLLSRACHPRSPLRCGVETEREGADRPPVHHDLLLDTHVGTTPLSACITYIDAS